MSVWERSRAYARVVRIGLVAGWAALPCSTFASQPELSAAPAASAVPAVEAATRAEPRAFQPFTRRAEPFNLTVSDERASSYAPKWRDIAVAIARDADILARCLAEPDRCPDAARRLVDIVAAAQAKSGRALLGDINRTVNLAIRFERDTLRPGGADAWASPLATLSTHRGDCEDYAILKYLALRQAGVAPGDLRLVVVRDLRRQEDHAVLAARLDDRWLVLDNRTLALVDDDNLAGYAAVTAFGAGSDDVRFADDGGPELARGSTPPLQADPS